MMIPEKISSANTGHILIIGRLLDRWTAVWVEVNCEVKRRPIREQFESLRGNADFLSTEQSNCIT